MTMTRKARPAAVNAGNTGSATVDGRTITGNAIIEYWTPTYVRPGERRERQTGRVCWDGRGQEWLTVETEYGVTQGVVKPEEVTAVYWDWAEANQRQEKAA